MKQEFCECEHSSSLYNEHDDWGNWDVCSDCKKPIEDTYQYFNHSDGEDHCDY